MSEYRPNIKKFRKNKFTQLSNVLVDDENLSCKSKGLFLYLWSKPDDWKFWNKDIIKHCTDGKDSILSGIRELEGKGYIVRIPVSPDGAHDGYQYYLSDEPDFLREEVRKELEAIQEDIRGVGGKSSQGVGGKSSNRQEENPPYTNTKSTNTNLVGDKSPEKKEKVGDREGIVLGSKLVDDLLLIQPNLNIGNKRESFAKDFALMIRQDARTVADIEGILEWLKSDSSSDSKFWRTNILSGGKFREKFDTLQIKMKQNNFVADNGGISKEVLKQYLIQTYGKSKSFFVFTDQAKKRVQVAFAGDHHTLANFNTGKFFESKEQAWLWNYMLENAENLFPKIKGRK